MNRNKLNHCFFVAEITAYSVFVVLFAVLGASDIVPERIVNIIYILFMLLSFGYLFALEFVFCKYDNAVHFKMLKKHYKPTGRRKRSGYKRKGLLFVVVLWMIYLLFVAWLKKNNFLKWYVFLIGACFMFILNSVFSRKKCLLSILFLRNKNHCCKNCGINCWDYTIFASSLAFAPRLSIVATILNWVIISLSVAILLMWEINYCRHPYRFYPETNQALNCVYCSRQCENQDGG